MLSNYFEFSKQMYEKFEQLYEMHLNAKLNLTAIKDRKDFYFKHILDSIYFIKYLDISFDSAMDLGSGGGFPGLILGLYFKNKKFILVDSVKKKCDFLLNCVSELGLQNVVVLNKRVEDIRDTKVDLVFSRGVGKVKEILTWIKKVSHETTGCLLYKGEQAFPELEDAKSELRKRKLEAGYVRVEEPFKRTYLYINSIAYRRVCPKD